MHKGKISNQIFRSTFKRHKIKKRGLDRDNREDTKKLEGWQSRFLSLGKKNSPN